VLEGRGIDFESIGLAIGYRRDVEAQEVEANMTIALADATIAREVAANAGRTAQMRVLFSTLREVAPDHEVLQETGRVFRSGERQLAYQTAWDDAYDAVARARGIPPATRAMSRGDQAYTAVMGEPIRETRSWFCRRIYWRDEEHRTVAGAKRARRRAAEQARRDA
jgi:hypothetical protein